MTPTRIVAAIGFAFTCATAAAADIVVTPPEGFGLAVKNAAGTDTLFRVAGDRVIIGTSGGLYLGASRFLNDTGAQGTFVGGFSGNITLTGADNTGVGYSALRNTTTGHSNAALGRSAMLSNTTGEQNVAMGFGAMRSGVNNHQSVAIGHEALYASDADFANTAIGYRAAYALGGNSNTAVGWSAMSESTFSAFSVAIGSYALQNSNGANNIAVGWQSGINITGDNNIAIGNKGVADDTDTIRIGTRVTDVQVPAHERTFIAGIRGKTTGSANAVAVVIDSNGQLGTISSSAGTKDDIADMAEVTSDLLKLRPVTFHYKADQDPAGRTLQYGLVAEEVEQVYPGLVAHSAEGKVETVLYQFLPPMLLNEFQKQQRRIEALESELAAIKRAVGVR